MTAHDRDERAEDDAERVVVRDRRRIDPVTGEVRRPAEDNPAGPGPTAESPTEPGPSDIGTDASAELAAQVAERTEDLQRVSAEFANYRRRVDRDREAVLVGARVQFVAELLTVLDDLDRAEQHGDLVGPFKAVADKIMTVVQKLGLEPFALVGEPFDPSVHEAVHHDTTEVEGPTVTVVAAVLRRGYRIADRVLRPAMVTVADRLDDGAAGETETARSEAARSEADSAEADSAVPGPAES